MNPLLFVGLCGVLVIGLLYAEQKESAALRLLFKPAASLAFVGAAIAAGAFQTGFGQILLAGLVLCAVGDILLIPRSPRFFLAGMGAFALSHAAYIGAFLAGGVAAAPGVGVAALVAAAFSGAMVFWLRGDLAAFRGPVIGYAAIISLMVAASAGHHAAAASSSSLMLVAAAGGFAISDAAVARDQFKRRAFINRLWGLPLYYAAQCLFALNV